MDKNAIKKYAVWARNELIARVTQKAQQYGITETDIIDANADSINGKLLTDIEKKQRQALIKKINEENFEQVMEEVAYTWFNRFTALRFMEVNNYLPSHTRVFTNDANEFKPQILADAISLNLEGLDMDKVYELKDANKNEELYKYLLIVQCNALNSILPRMFQKIADYTELLLPDYLLREGSVIERLIALIPADNFDVSTDDGQIEIIGWLYQYYISEKHEDVVNISNKGPVKKEDIPAATQLFTTDWVVRYIVDNSIGRYWIEHNPNSNLAEKLKYFVGINETEKKSPVKPEELTFFDPCIGSGHFAVYAFDVLMNIYVEYGYTEREATAAIVKNNIFGIDIDNRASQLAYFSIMMKARQYDRRFFSKKIQPNVYTFVESNNVTSEIISFFSNGDTELREDINKIVTIFKNSKNYGSLLNIPIVNWKRINERRKEISEEISLQKMIIEDELIPILDVAELLSRKYAVVDTNPPYLNKFNEELKNFLDEQYGNYSSDLFSAFIYRNFMYAVKDGYVGFMTPFVWMYIKSYEKLRRFILNNKGIATLIQMEYSAYEEATVPICTFVLSNDVNLTKGKYFDLSKFVGGMEIQRKKVIEAISDNTVSFYHEFEKENFDRIEGCPLAFMTSEKLLRIFETASPLKQIAEPKVGLQTAKNDIYLRLWYECDINKVGFSYKSLEETEDGKYKWIPYNKGGAFRRWYGNRNYVINWENNGRRVRQQPGAVIRNPQYYLRPCITWSDITSASFSGRFCEGGFLFDVKGSCCFPEIDKIEYILGFLNSKISQKCIKILNPTISTQVGDMARIPVYFDVNYKEEIDNLVRECIEYSKEDWDSEECSWGFISDPLVDLGKDKISDAFELWQQKCEDRFNKLKMNERRLNQIFIEIYGLESEMDCDVEDKSVESSCRLAEREKSVRKLICYAVGCMFGRYSLGKPGIAYAGGRWDSTIYEKYAPDKDNIIPICDDEYFQDDIVNRFVDFIRIAFGEEYLEENLQYIADSLKGKGNYIDILRNYFINDFYSDICNIYSLSGAGKRPVYWLFDSGKKNAFKCLIYMHRYQPDTIARIRTDYVHEQQSRYRTEIADIEQRLNNASTGERVKLNKKLKTLTDQAEELRIYEEKIHHLADQMISIDLDDGVKVNYEKFKDVLAKIK